MKEETDAGVAVATAVVIRSGLPRWLRYGWAFLVTVASLGGWVVDHCDPPGPAGQVLRSIRAARSRPEGPAGARDRGRGEEPARPVVD